MEINCDREELALLRNHHVCDDLIKLFSPIAEFSNWRTARYLRYLQCVYVCVVNFASSNRGPEEHEGRQNWCSELCDKAYPSGLSVRPTAASSKIWATRYARITRPEIIVQLFGHVWISIPAPGTKSLCIVRARSAIHPLTEMINYILYVVSSPLWWHISIIANDIESIRLLNFRLFSEEYYIMYWRVCTPWYNTVSDVIHIYQHVSLALWPEPYPSSILCAFYSSGGCIYDGMDSRRITERRQRAYSRYFDKCIVLIKVIN